jgi:hypothetical protein
MDTQAFFAGYRITFFAGGRQWVATLAEAQRLTKKGRLGTIAVWTGTRWAD